MASRAAKAFIGKPAPSIKANSWVSSANHFKEISL
jgi:hypothetical protein